MWVSPSQTMASTAAESFPVGSFATPRKPIRLVPGMGARRTQSKMLKGSWMLLATPCRSVLVFQPLAPCTQYFTVSSVFTPATTSSSPLFCS